MHLNWLTPFAAEQKIDNTGFVKQNQAYLYVMYRGETMADLNDDFFYSKETKLKKNDLILVYSPSENSVVFVRVLDNNGGNVSIQLIDDIDPHASETVFGVIKLATAEMVADGTDDTTAITPAKLKTVSDAVYSAMDSLEEVLQTQIDGKQDTLTFDDEPTADSANPVKSAGIKAYVDAQDLAHAGQGLVLGFDGTYTDGKLVFTPEDGMTYTVKPNYDYEIDLHYPDIEELPDETPFFLKLSADGEEIPLRNVKSVSSPATYKQMTQVSDIIDGIGTRWIFMSRYKENVNDKCFGIIATVVKADAEGGSSRNVGEIVTSSMPLSDVGLVLANGAKWAVNGMYKSGIEKIIALQSTTPELFCTEEEFQASLTDYGVCGKYVYDTDAGTLRVPKIVPAGRKLIKSYVQDGVNVAIYSDGWCEQSGTTYDGQAHPIVNTVTIPVAYRDISYIVTVGTGTASAAASLNSGYTGNVSTNQFNFTGQYNGSSDANWTAWRTEGYINLDSYQGEQLYYYICLANNVKTADEAVTEQLVQDLAIKADTSLSNVTEQGKANSIAWGMPDYSAGVQVESFNNSNPFTAPSDCLIHWSIHVASGYNGFVYVDGAEVYAAGSYSGGSVCIVQKGSLVTTNTAKASLYYYPLKGAV